MTETSLPYAQLGTDTAAGTGVGAWFSLLQAKLGVWRRRSRQRRYLVQMRWREIADMGVPRDAIEREAAKPFWRA